MLLPPQVSPPEFAFTDAPPSRVVGAAVVALPVLIGEDGPELGPGSAELADDLGIDLLETVEWLGGTGVVGRVDVVPLVRRADLVNPSLHTVLLVGVGEGSPTDCRRAGAALARAARGQHSVSTSIPSVGGSDCLTAFVEGAVLGSFSLTMRSVDASEPPVKRIVLAHNHDPEEGLLARALAFAGAGWLARSLATVPSNIKSPQWLADQAVSTAKHAGLEIDVWDENALDDQGFGGLVGVGRGSVSPPRLVRLGYRPTRGARKAPHVVLVGKGITFDSGGLNIKPGESMVNMKRDMSGAAVVLAVMAALADIGCPIRVTGLMCIAENSVGGDSMRPGDVLRQYGGRTTEVVNTDAEGRLVLADGLAYAVEKLKPDAVVDVATLTGGIKVALGLQTGGLFSNDDALAATLLAAGAEAGEPLWRMPLVEDYEERLKSEVADALNAPTGAPAITAALFLRHFTGGLPWAHLDIASVGDAVENSFEWTKGPTGFGPRLLLRWLGSADPLEGVAR